jgi:hypothetical protein
MIAQQLPISVLPFRRRFRSALGVPLSVKDAQVCASDPDIGATRSGLSHWSKPDMKKPRTGRWTGTGLGEVLRAPYGEAPGWCQRITCYLAPSGVHGEAAKDRWPSWQELTAQ